MGRERERGKDREGKNLAQMKTQETMHFVGCMINSVSKILQEWEWFLTFCIRGSLLIVP